MIKRENTGITLIALVITIIVLLILAGITINLTIGEQGVIRRAQQATTEDAHGKVLERLRIEEQNYMIEKNMGATQDDIITYFRNNHIIDENNIVNVEGLFGSGFPKGRGTGQKDVYKIEENTELAKLASKEAVNIASSEKAKEYILVYYDANEKGKKIGVLAIENPDSGIWGGILEEYKAQVKEKGIEGTKPKEQVSDTYLGIGTDGQPTNMDYFKGLKEEEDGFYFMTEQNAYGYNPGITDDAVDDEGRLKIALPEYIYSAETKEFKPLKGIRGLFSFSSLIYAPVIPSTVVDMSYAFSDSFYLEEMPEIPEGVTNMEMTFMGCSRILETTVIPDSVENMRGTFAICEELKSIVNFPENLVNAERVCDSCYELLSVPVLHSKVRNISGAFYNCNNLSGEILIESKNIDNIETSPFEFNGEITVKGYKEVIDLLKAYYEDFNECNITFEYID